MSIGVLLVVEGLLIALLVAARAACLKVIDVDSIPKVIQGRVALGTRLAPAIGFIAFALIVSGSITTLLSR